MSTGQNQCFFLHFDTQQNGVKIVHEKHQSLQSFFMTMPITVPNEKANDVHTNNIMPEGSSNGWKRK
jgi:hypothetical protein